jgi:hypothetical protein
VNKPVGRCAQDENPERERRDVLLILDVPVHSNEGVISPGCALDQLAVRDAGPPDDDYGVNTVASQLEGEIYRNVLVK